jgi:hypothetical protein
MTLRHETRLRCEVGSRAQVLVLQRTSPQNTPQDKFSQVVSLAARRTLRVVPPSEPPRLEIRIDVSDPRGPIGRSRIFQIEEQLLAELIGAVERLEARHV